jgi:hypothetical protein
MRTTSRFISLLASLITLACGITGLAQEPTLKDLAFLGGVKWDGYGFPYDVSEISKMPNDDPRLIAGYIVVLNAEGITKDWVQAFADDIQRRGEAAGPILLKIVKDRSSWTKTTRENILWNLDRYPGFDHRPFIEAARQIWRENKFKTPVRMCHAICDLLEAKGDASDLQIIEEILTYPEAEIPWINTSRPERMRKRLSGNLLPAEWHDASGRPPAGYEWIDPQSKKAWRFVGAAKPEAKPLPTQPTEEPTSSTPWSIIVILIVAAGGLLWLLVKRRK